MKNVLNYHIQALKDSFSLLAKGKFLVYFLPGVIATILFFLFNSLLSSVFGSDTALNEEAGWFSVAIIKVGSVFEFITTQFYIFLVITLFSPFNTILSEKVDAHLTGQKFEFSIIRIINDLIRMVFIVIIALFFEFILIGLWWFFCWIVGINDTFVYKAFSFLIGAFFFGFSFYDHSLERYQISVGASMKFAFSNLFLVLLTGMIFKTLYYFPFFGSTPYIGIAIAPVITTMISTIVYIQYRKLYNPNSI